MNLFGKKKKPNTVTDKVEPKFQNMEGISVNTTGEKLEHSEDEYIDKEPSKTDVVTIEGEKGVVVPKEKLSSKLSAVDNAKLLTLKTQIATAFGKDAKDKLRNAFIAGAWNGYTKEIKVLKNEGKEITVENLLDPRLSSLYPEFLEQLEKLDLKMEFFRGVAEDVIKEYNKDPVGFGQPKKVVKVGRNDPCPCGSGKKYKRCCGR